MRAASPGSYAVPVSAPLPADAGVRHDVPGSRATSLRPSGPGFADGFRPFAHWALVVKKALSSLSFFGVSGLYIR